MPQPILLIVDDEKSTRDGLRMALEDQFDCYVASDAKQAFQILKNESVDLLLTDLRLGADSGMDILDHTLALKNPPTAIMMTAYGSVDTAVEAMRRGAWHFVTKPLNIDEVEMLLLRASRNKQLEGENKRLSTENRTLRVKSGSSPSGLDRILGKSAPIKGVTDMVEQVAPTRATILIEGETGTGKELVAHSIHDLSGRPQEKFVVVNCAALSAQLLESELFGHEKGSFTGASQRRIGRFEQADGGTLFLDEIAEIDSATQVKLLRALSERTIERVGSNTSVQVDVRVVAATNKDLQDLVQKGEFRKDLYFRLNVVSIFVPPLRDRAEDVILLASEFLKEFAAENNKSVKPLTDASLDLLRSYQWPGNVRELRTAIEHGVVMSNTETIAPQHLPRFLAPTAPPNLSKPATIPLAQQNTLAPDPEFNLHALESEAIAQALSHAEGNRTKAAQLLGISRRTLQRKLSSISSL
jgi:two-component system response regulator AtoC